MKNMKNNYNNNKKATLNAKNFEKKFETFEDMIEELKCVNTDFKEVFASIGNNGDYEITPLNAIFCLIDYMNNGNIPNVLTGENLPTAVSISANKASLKTAHFTSFKWSFKYNKEKELSDITAVITVFLRDKNSESVEETLNLLASEESGWKELVVTNTNKFRNNKNRNNYYNKEKTTEEE